MPFFRNMLKDMAEHGETNPICTCDKICLTTNGWYTPPCKDLNQFGTRCSIHGDKLGYKCLQCKGITTDSYTRTRCGHILCESCYKKNDPLICDDCKTYKR